MEDDRNQTSQGIIWVQKSFRGFRACSHYQQLKKGATVLQSCTCIVTEELLGFVFGVLYIFKQSRATLDNLVIRKYYIYTYPL